MRTMATKRKVAKKTKSAKKRKVAAKSSYRRAMSVATSAEQTVKQRVAAMAEVPLAVCESDKNLQAMLNVLRNKDEPVEVRLAPLQSFRRRALAASHSSLAAA